MEELTYFSLKYEQIPNEFTKITIKTHKISSTRNQNDQNTPVSIEIDFINESDNNRLVRFHTSVLGMHSDCSFKTKINFQANKPNTCIRSIVIFEKT